MGLEASGGLRVVQSIHAVWLLATVAAHGVMYQLVVNGGEGVGWSSVVVVK